MQVFKKAFRLIPETFITLGKKKSEGKEQQNVRGKKPNDDPPGCMGALLRHSRWRYSTICVEYMALQINLLWKI